MGTLGSKVGTVVGPVVAFFTAEPLMRLILGGCFFEEGCGGTEVTRLLSLAFALSVTAVVAGLAARELINRAILR